MMGVTQLSQKDSESNTAVINASGTVNNASGTKPSFGVTQDVKANTVVEIEREKTPLEL